VGATPTGGPESKWVGEAGLGEKPLNSFMFPFVARRPLPARRPLDALLAPLDALLAKLGQTFLSWELKCRGLDERWNHDSPRLGA
jgi:hypothetical protein